MGRDVADEHYEMRSCPPEGGLGEPLQIVGPVHHGRIEWGELDLAGWARLVHSSHTRVGFETTALDILGSPPAESAMDLLYAHFQALADALGLQPELPEQPGDRLS